MFRQFLKISAVLAVLGGLAYIFLFKPNVPTDSKVGFVKIPTGTNFEQLVQILNGEGIISDEDDFRRWSGWLSFSNPRAGRYRIEQGWSSYDLINELKKGEQAPVRVVLNNERTPNQVAAKVAKTLEMDSAAFATAFGDMTLLDSLGIKKEELMCYFLPNTYEFMWNTDPKKFIIRMKKEFDRFWNEQRRAKAQAQNLTPQQVIVMASIVDGETRHDDERPKVAAAYLNRLKQGMKLQADPTVQFALMEIEKTASFRRLFNSDYLTPHPYNTYVNQGLPPGPICMPAPSSVDAVLAPEANNFIYFCAKPDNSGYHNFAETYEQHLVNVKLYQNWLAQQK